MGTLTTSQNGNVTTLEINSNNFYSGSAIDEMRASLQFSTANGSLYESLGNDGTPFYGQCSLICTNNINNTSFAIQQNSTTSYSFYYFTGSYPGNGVFSVRTHDTFTYSGTQVNPSGCWINPATIYTVGLDGSGTGHMYINGIHSNSFISNTDTYSIYDINSINLAIFKIDGSTVLSNLNISGNFASSRITGTSLFISGAETVLSTLNVSGNFSASSISGSALSITGSGTIGTNLNSIGTLFVSGNTTLRSTLNVNLGITGTTLSILGNINASGASHIMNASSGGGDVSLTLRNFASGTTSLYLNNNNNNTLSSRLFTDALGNVSMQAYTGTSSIRFLCGSTPYFQITSAGGANISDARFKTNVSNITDAISTITQLQGVYYTMLSDPTNTQQIGFIADDLKPIVPQVISTGVDENGDEINFMVYCRLTSLLVEGIKEQQQQIHNNISSISSLHTRLSILENV